MNSKPPPIYLFFRLGNHASPESGEEMPRRAETIIHLGYMEYQVVLQTMHETPAANCVLS
jgi:hypothetical protein